MSKNLAHVNFKATHEMVNKLDKLVLDQVFENRSEAIRYMIDYYFWKNYNSTFTTVLIPPSTLEGRKIKI